MMCLCIVVTRMSQEPFVSHFRRVVRHLALKFIYYFLNASFKESQMNKILFLLTPILVKIYISFETYAQ